MDCQHILAIAEIKLKGKSDYIIKEIQDRISSGSTSGEISSMVGKYLKDLKLNNKTVYFLLEDDINEYIRECKENGLEII